MPFGFEVEKKNHTPKLIHQVHGRIFRWLERQSEPVDADAIITSTDREIYIFTADCLPVLLYSENQNSPVAAIHAGWRGLQAGVVRAVYQEISQFPGPWHAVLGPALLSCCFEVQKDFPLRQHLIQRQKKTFFDPITFLKTTQLPTSILYHEQSLRCTYCSGGLPSFRRNKSTDPQIRAWVKKAPSA